MPYSPYYQRQMGLRVPSLLRGNPDGPWPGGHEATYDDLNPALPVEPDALDQNPPLYDVGSGSPTLEFTGTGTAGGAGGGGGGSFAGIPDIRIPRDMDQVNFTDLGSGVGNNFLESIGAGLSRYTPAGRLLNTLYHGATGTLGEHGDNGRGGWKPPIWRLGEGAYDLIRKMFGDKGGIKNVRIPNPNDVAITDLNPDDSAEGSDPRGTVDPTALGRVLSNLGFDRGSVSGQVGSIGYGTSIPIATRYAANGSRMPGPGYVGGLMFGNPPVNYQGQTLK